MHHNQFCDSELKFDKATSPKQISSLASTLEPPRLEEHETTIISGACAIDEVQRAGLQVV